MSEVAGPEDSDQPSATLLGVWDVSRDATDEDLDAQARVIAIRMLARTRADDQAQAASRDLARTNLGHDLAKDLDDLLR
jgi:hypothetical protein